VPLCILKQTLTLGVHALGAWMVHRVWPRQSTARSSSVPCLASRCSDMRDGHYLGENDWACFCQLLALASASKSCL
jgi:hypothetical protein